MTEGALRALHRRRSGRVVRFRPDDDHVASRSYVCPKAPSDQRAIEPLSGMAYLNGFPVAAERVSAS